MNQTPTQNPQIETFEDVFNQLVEHLPEPLLEKVVQLHRHAVIRAELQTEMIAFLTVKLVNVIGEQQA